MSTTMITLPADHNYLASLPNGVCDEVGVDANGKVTMTLRVGKVILNGSETWNYGTDYQRANTPIGDPMRAGSDIGDARKSAMCSSYVLGTYGGISDKTFFIFSNGEIFITDMSISTKVDWLAYLAANPTTVYYQFATPMTLYSADNGATWSTTDPAAGQSAIPLQKGTNNIWCTDTLSPIITLDYNTQVRTRKRRISELYWMGNEPKKRLTWGQLAAHTWRDIGSKSIQEWYFSGTAEVVENAYINYEIGEL